MAQTNLDKEIRELVGFLGNPKKEVRDSAVAALKRIGAAQAAALRAPRWVLALKNIALGTLALVWVILVGGVIALFLWNQLLKQVHKKAPELPDVELRN